MTDDWFARFRNLVTAVAVSWLLIAAGGLGMGSVFWGLPDTVSGFTDTMMVALSRVDWFEIVSLIITGTGVYLQYKHRNAPKQEGQK